MHLHIWSLCPPKLEPVAFCMFHVTHQMITQPSIYATTSWKEGRAAGASSPPSLMTRLQYLHTCAALPIDQLKWCLLKREIQRGLRILFPAWLVAAPEGSGCCPINHPYPVDLSLRAFFLWAPTSCRRRSTFFRTVFGVQLQHWDHSSIWLLFDNFKIDYYRAG